MLVLADALPFSSVTREGADYVIHVALHSQNLKKFEKVTLEHNFKVAWLSGLEGLALCFESSLWKEFLTKLRFFMRDDMFVFIVNFLSSSCQGCLHFTIFLVSPCFHFSPFFLQVSAKLYHPPKYSTPVLLLNVCVISGLAPWQAWSLHLGLACVAGDLLGHPPPPYLWFSARCEHVWRTESEASEH